MRVVSDYYKLLPSFYGKGKGVGLVLVFYCVCSFLQLTIYTFSRPLVIAV